MYPGASPRGDPGFGGRRLCRVFQLPGGEHAPLKGADLITPNHEGLIVIKLDDDKKRPLI